ncbi:MAG: ATP-binding protein [Deltaproteobacteria bacterium]|nr:ATP-binding protein [Deltaproteobacteria bacterium]
MRSRLAGGLGLQIAVVALLAGGLAVVVHQSRRAVRGVEHDAQLARRVRALGVDAREQYIHEAHTLVVGNRSHVEHHGRWAEHFRREARALAAELPAGERPGLDAIARRSVEVERAFAREILPAVDRGDRAAMASAHDRVEGLVVEMIRAADHLGDYFERRAAATAAAAERLNRLALGFALGIVAIGLTASAAIVRGVWRAVASPLLRMRRVAERVAGGDDEARVGALSVPELDAVGRAFDQMLDRVKARESALVEAERLAVLGRIAAGVAHEINNPIGVILGYVKTMRAEAHEAQLAGELAILDEEARACQRIAEDLLAYARAPALERTEVDVSAIVRDAVKRLAGHGELAGCEVRETVATCQLWADPLRLRQVLGNLLRNAAQSLEGRGSVEVHGRVEGDRYFLEVLDRGRGIDPGLQGRLFEPFATARAEGTGLGLAVCAAIVHAHGGAIRGEARAGGGARFVVDLPLQAAAGGGRP